MVHICLTLSDIVRSHYFIWGLKISDTFDLREVCRSTASVLNSREKMKKILQTSGQSPMSTVLVKVLMWRETECMKEWRKKAGFASSVPQPRKGKSKVGELIKEAIRKETGLEVQYPLTCTKTNVTNCVNWMNWFGLKSWTDTKAWCSAIGTIGLAYSNVTSVPPNAADICTR